LRISTSDVEGEEGGGAGEGRLVVVMRRTRERVACGGGRLGVVMEGGR